MKTTKIISTGLLSLMAVGASLFTLVTPAHAVTVDPTRTTQLTDTISQARCTRVTTRVDDRIAFYNARKEVYVARHQLVVDRLESVFSRLQNRGYDLSKLKSDREQLLTLKAQFVTIHSQLVQSLNDLKNIACNGGTKTQYDEKLAVVQNNLKSQREKAKEIVTYTKNTIIPDLKDLRNQVQKTN